MNDLHSDESYTTDPNSPIDYFTEDKDDADFIEANLPLETMYPISAGFERVYVMHCAAWKQTYVTREASKFFPCTAVNPTIVRRKWIGHTYKEITYSLLPGYIFLFSTEDMDPGLFRGLDGYISILQYVGGRYSLTEEDENLARWLLKYNGTIGLSLVTTVGRKIKVVQGPMQDSNGVILEVNRQRRRAKVEIQFNGRAVPVWMDFDFIE